jgi:hypothetical protein
MAKHTHDPLKFKFGIFKYSAASDIPIVTYNENKSENISIDNVNKYNE